VQWRDLQFLSISRIRGAWLDRASVEMTKGGAALTRREIREQVGLPQFVEGMGFSPYINQSKWDRL
jgi:hypothetical protein